jgi:hypothetical protein
VAPLERALASNDAWARERALERLSGIGNGRALELVVRALEPSGSAQSARERLLCVRVLAAHVREPKVREALVRVMTGISVNAELREPLHALLRDSAALALAASGEPSAFEALGKALRQPGRVAQAAAAAVVAHPPRDLNSLLAPLRTPTLELVWALENLADERAFEPLREIVRRGGTELSSQAALALTRLGNFETVELARQWARSGKQQTALVLAAAEILALAGEAEGEALVSELLKDPDTRSRALELAAQRGAWARVLAPLLVGADRHEAVLVITALGRSEDPAALQVLSGLARGGPHADDAVYALALSPAREAADVLTALLSVPAARRRAARAAILRRAALGANHAPEGLDGVLETLVTSRSAADRSVGAFGQALVSSERARALLEHRDPALVEAAARAAFAAGAAPEAARRLVGLTGGPTRSQLALALVHADARSVVPTRTLLDLLAEAGQSAPLALFALGERDGDGVRPLLAQHLASSDPQLRSHAALGLGGSPEASALALLEAAYRFEVEPRVRLAVVLALGVRPESVRRRTLELAARLDPDAQVRQAAALALAGVRPSFFAPGIGTVWLKLEGPEGPGRKAAKLEIPGGLALPVLADPDGVAALAGLPAGPVRIRLAREGREGKALP